MSLLSMRTLSRTFPWTKDEVVMNSEDRWGTVPAALDDQRLDRALSFLCPELSLRQRRAMFTGDRVTVNGRPARPGMRVETGMVVRVCVQNAACKEPAEIEPCRSLWIVVEKEGLAAVNKPSGMHSARGRDVCSVEECLPSLFAGQQALLLNRLDALTSGLVLVGCTKEGAERYFTAQEQGAICKEYLAVVDGLLERRMEIRNLLDSAKRRKVRFLAGENPDCRRHTQVTPVREIGGKTLVRAEIVKGQRHQIRAHLAGVGHPIVGDPLYGKGHGGTMFLHHARIAFAGFAAESAPGWLDSDGTSLLCDPEK